MKIIPSIDLQNGKCVRLEQGDFNRQTIYDLSPSAKAQEFYREGARSLHVVDLDGAREEGMKQDSAISQIRQAFPGALQVGGGIRNQIQIEALFDLGVDKIVLGSLALLDSDLTQSFISKYGFEKIVLALDFRLVGSLPMIAIKGWQEATPWSLWDVLERFSDQVEILCTDISKDGMGFGPSMGFYQDLVKRHAPNRIQASGGITTLEDLRSLNALGFGSAIVGKAFYQGKISLKETLECLN
ncbi:MAG: 1-(5-phosphoribosyl)-5-[(5-phosphoribosylamino)methylideneamino] imidazole-4-carboxamide isomerase [Pseudomonadota bacterium]